MLAILNTIAILRPIVPSKVGFFAWEVSWEQVLTTTQLKNRGFHLASISATFWEGRRTEPHSNPLSLHLGAVDTSSFGFWCKLGHPTASKGSHSLLDSFPG